MATVTISVVATSTVTTTKTVSGADLLRFIAAYRKIFNIPAATDAEVVQAWENFVFSEAKRAVRSVEDETAKESAISGGSEIVLT